MSYDLADAGTIEPLAQQSIGLPVALSPKAAGEIALPKDLARVAAGEIAAPIVIASITPPNIPKVEPI